MREEKKIERLVRELFNVLCINEIFNCFFSVTALSFAHCFIEKIGFFVILDDENKGNWNNFSFGLLLAKTGHANSNF